MVRIPLGQMLRVIVTAALVVSTPRADEMDDAIAREEAQERDMAQVSDGTLEFLAEPPADPVHAYSNRITVTPASLRSGWVLLEQCHRHLDPVPSAEIVFHPDRVRNLQVSDHAGIGSIVIDGAKVQLGQVAPDARLCVTAESRALQTDGAGRFVLRNGPYMRRFLDGYFPLHVSMDVRWAPGTLRYEGSLPPAQPGFEVAPGSDRVVVDAWFRGRLTTELRFQDARVSSLP